MLQTGYMSLICMDFSNKFCLNSSCKCVPFLKHSKLATSSRYMSFANHTKCCLETPSSNYVKMHKWSSQCMTSKCYYKQCMMKTAPIYMPKDKGRVGHVDYATFGRTRAAESMSWSLFSVTTLVAIFLRSVGVGATGGKMESKWLTFLSNITKWP